MEKDGYVTKEDFNKFKEGIDHQRDLDKVETQTMFKVYKETSSDNLESVKVHLKNTIEDAVKINGNNFTIGVIGREVPPMIDAAIDTKGREVAKEEVSRATEGILKSLSSVEGKVDNIPTLIKDFLISCGINAENKIEAQKENHFNRQKAKDHSDVKSGFFRTMGSKFAGWIFGITVTIFLLYKYIIP